MDRLVFIDDDEDELARVKDLVAGAYEFVQVHWPQEKPTEELIGRPPDLFVSDLYMPPSEHRVDPADHCKEVLEAQAARAGKIAERILRLYPGPRHAKKRLKETMDCLNEGRGLLDAQCEELEQSPRYGLELFLGLRRSPIYRVVPFVFYSRKITPEDVEDVLAAGATAAIRKRDWKNPEKFLELLRRAQSVHRSALGEQARKLGLNVNTTLFPQ